MAPLAESLPPPSIEHCSGFSAALSAPRAAVSTLCSRTVRDVSTPSLWRDVRCTHQPQRKGERLSRLHTQAGRQHLWVGRFWGAVPEGAMGCQVQSPRGLCHCCCGSWCPTNGLGGRFCGSHPAKFWVTEMAKYQSSSQVGVFTELLFQVMCIYGTGVGTRL